MLFNPTQELVKDTYRLAKLATEIGMDLHPNSSLSHIIFSWPSSCSWSLGNDAVPLPFPSLTTASMSHLRLFVNLSRGFFKLVFLKNDHSPVEKIESLNNNNWDCTSSCLFSRITGKRIHSMDGFSKALLGMGWTLFKTNANNQAFQDSTNQIDSWNQDPGAWQHEIRLASDQLTKKMNRFSLISIYSLLTAVRDPRGNRRIIKLGW
ncbi:hypothetical protein Adt_20311 [Abeliophyllum distichum]|uniref:Uncharacterized protein n=1 Tax=Abeliophyllum distichum TaxID=126358 RepID=A0ABD1SW70_9LAMI